MKTGDVGAIAIVKFRLYTVRELNKELLKNQVKY